MEINCGLFLDDFKHISLPLLSLILEKNIGLLSELRPHQDESVRPGEGCYL